MLLFRLTNKEINLITKLVKAISVDYMMLISELTHFKGINRNIITNSQFTKIGGNREWNKPVWLIENIIIALTKCLKWKFDKKL